MNEHIEAVEDTMSRRQRRHRHHPRADEPRTARLPEIGASAAQIPLSEIARNLGITVPSLPNPGPRDILALATHPDLESATIVPLCYITDAFRRNNLVAADAILILTKSGMPRSVDFPTVPEADLNGRVLEEKHRILFLDSGGGRFDSHLVAANREKSALSSTEIILADPAIRAECEVLLPALRAIAEYDASATPVAKDDNFKNSPFPHTQRTYPQIVKGWRFLVECGIMTPALMVRNWFIAYLAVEQQLMAAFESTDMKDFARAIEEMDPRAQGIYLMDSLVAGAEIFFKNQAERGALHPVEATRAARAFAEDCRRALTALEAQWATAEREFHTRGNLEGRYFAARLPLLKPDQSQELEPGAQDRTVVLLTVGTSESPRIGQLLRRKALRHLEIRGRHPREREVVSHVVRPNGGWIVSTQRATLHEVAAALRVSEVLTSDGTIPPESDPRATGSFTYRDRTGKTAEGAFFAPFQTAVGTEFDTRRGELSPGPLTTSERDRVVLKVLTGEPPTFGDYFACTAPAPTCEEECPLYRWQFSGCAAFRAQAQAAATTNVAEPDFAAEELQDR